MIASCAATVEGQVRVQPVFIQPMAADDVAAALAKVVTEPPVTAVDIAGPDRFRLDELVRTGLRGMDDQRRVNQDPNATYFGASLSENTLVPSGSARLGRTRFADWLARSSKPKNQVAQPPAIASASSFAT